MPDQGIGRARPCSLNWTISGAGRMAGARAGRMRAASFCSARSAPWLCTWFGLWFACAWVPFRCAMSTVGARRRVRAAPERGVVDPHVVRGDGHNPGDYCDEERGAEGANDARARVPRTRRARAARARAARRTYR